MSNSTYAKHFAVPEALPGVLRDLTREILRNNPKDVEAFCLEYFQAKMEQQTDELIVGGPDSLPSKDLTVNLQRKGGDEVISTRVMLLDTVEATLLRLSPDFYAEMRHKGTFDNFPKDTSLMDNGVAGVDEVDVIISDMARGEPLKTSWPELVGTNGEEAVLVIKRENSTLVNVHTVPEGSIVTRDWREDRVRVFIDGSGNVTSVPNVG